jgi:hypothetical protein
MDVPYIRSHDLPSQEKQDSRRRKGMKAIGNLLSSEGMNAAAMLALSGTLVALVVKGDGPLSLKRVVAQTLSNPVPKVAAGTSRYISIPAPPRQIAA